MFPLTRKIGFYGQTKKNVPKCPTFENWPEIKMLTPTDLKNIKNFEKLNPNHRRVFKHRLIKKCVACQKDLEFVLLNYVGLGLKADKIIDIEQLVNVVKCYEKLYTLQNV